jgi:hypothetical protein
MINFQTKVRTYSELLGFPDFNDRYNYLKLSGSVGESTFGFDRYINQEFYRSREWKQIRREVIIRDNGCDMGVQDYEIYGKIIVHHMNPIQDEDLLQHNIHRVIDPEFLVCVSHMTHQAIHFGSDKLLPQLPVERKKGDTKLW